MPTKLSIPDRYVTKLAQLVRLSPEELAAFLGAVREAKPTLALTDLTSSIAHRLSLDRSRMSEIVRVLADLQAVREGLDLSVSEFVTQLRAALDATGQEDLHPTDWTAFENAVTEALSGENALAVSSKARNVIGEYSHAYCSCRILTDLRPIFKSDVEQEPAAFVVVHTLRMTYHTNEEHQDFYVALNEEGLDDLTVQIERARKKEASLRTLTHGNDIPVLKV